MDKIGHKKLKNYDMLMESNKVATKKSSGMQNALSKMMADRLKDHDIEVSYKEHEIAKHEDVFEKKLCPCCHLKCTCKFAFFILFFIVITLAAFDMALVNGVFKSDAACFVLPSPNTNGNFTCDLQLNLTYVEPKSKFIQGAVSQADLLLC